MDGWVGGWVGGWVVGSYGRKSLEYSLSCLMLSLPGSTEMNSGFTCIGEVRTLCMYVCLFVCLIP